MIGLKLISIIRADIGWEMIMRSKGIEHRVYNMYILIVSVYVKEALNKFSGNRTEN